MVKIDFGGVEENVVTRDEMPLDKARRILRNETIAVVGYGVQGPAQSLNLRDNGFNVIVGQEPRFEKDWQKAIEDGWKQGVSLFPVAEAVKRGTTIEFLVSDAAQKAVWPTLVEPNLNKGDALYFSHGFSIVFKDQTGVIAPHYVDVIMAAPKGAGASVRKLFLEQKGINSSYAVNQDATGRASERTLALGIGIGSGYLFPTTFENEVLSDLTGERAILLGEVWALAESTYRQFRLDADSKGAFIDSSEQLTQVILPLIGEEGAEGVYRRAAESNELNTVKKYRNAVRNAVAPVMDQLYTSVADGTETRIVLDVNSRPDYADKLRDELDAIDDSEMWKTGKAVRENTPDRSYGGKITNWGLAGAVLGAMEAQYQILIDKGHSPSEAANETVEELTQSLNPFYQQKGVTNLIANCSSTAQRGALDWGPRFEEAITPVYNRLSIGQDVDLGHAQTSPDMWKVMEKVRSLRPERLTK